MRFNRNVDNYYNYIEEIRKENKLQSELYKKIGKTRYKIKRLERELLFKTIDKQRKGVIKDINNCYKAINDYTKEVEHSRDRKHYFEQKVCNHSFGVIIDEYIDEGITYQKGICLECDAEVNGCGDKLFIHSIEKQDKVSIDEYKNRLDSLKKKYKYNNFNCDYDLEERIVKEMNTYTKSLKKSRY